MTPQTGNLGIFHLLLEFTLSSASSLILRRWPYSARPYAQPPSWGRPSKYSWPILNYHFLCDAIFLLLFCCKFVLCMVLRICTVGLGSGRRQPNAPSTSRHRNSSSTLQNGSSSAAMSVFHQTESAIGRLNSRCQSNNLLSSRRCCRQRCRRCCRGRGSSGGGSSPVERIHLRTYNK